MVIDAKVIKIEENKTLYGILDSNGQCSSGSCEGCRCSTKMKTISLPTNAADHLTIGMNVEIHQNRTYLLHFALVIILPLVVMAGIQIIPYLSNWSPKNLEKNTLAMGGGFITFVLTSVMVYVFRDKEALFITPKEDS